MTIQISGKNLDIGDAFRTYVTERVDAAISKYVGGDLTGYIRLEKNHGRFRTSCSINLRSGLSLESQGEGGDAYASADAAFQRLETRLRRHKRRLKAHHQARHEARFVEAAGDSVSTRTDGRDYVVLPGEDDTDDAAPSSPLVIAETELKIDDIAVSEAVMQLDLSNAPVMVFRNAGNGRINFVYRRSDGNIGWIDPDPD